MTIGKKIPYFRNLHLFSVSNRFGWLIVRIGFVEFPSDENILSTRFSHLV